MRRVIKAEYEEGRVIKFKPTTWLLQLVEEALRGWHWLIQRSEFKV